MLKTPTTKGYYSGNMTRVKDISIRFLLITLILVTSFAYSQTATIEDYIDQATKNSPLLKDLNNQALINKLDSALILANYKPQVGFNSTGTYAPVIRGFGYDEALSNGKTFNALLTVNQSLLGKARMNNDILGLNLLTDSIHNAVRLSQQDLRKTISSQYITTYASQIQAGFGKEVHDLLMDENEILKKLIRANVYKQTDYLSFLITLNQQEIQLKQDQMAYLNNLATLNYLSGMQGTDSVKLSEPKLNLQAAEQTNQSIFLKQYQLDSLRIENSRRVIDLNYKPRVGVYADAGYNSSFILDAYKNFGLSAGFTVSVPIYDGHQKKLQYNKLDLQEQTRGNYRDYYLRQYNRQLAQLKQQLQQSESLFSKIKEQIKFTESLMNVDRKLLQTGDILISDYISAIRNYLDAQNALRQTMVTRLELINQSNYWNQ